MSVKIVKINDVTVHPVKFGGNEDNRPIKGSDLFSEIYANIYICSKKHSGKTTIIDKIVKECCTTETTVIVFCSTLFKDNGHLAIKKYCKKKGIPYIGYESLKDDVGIDRLDVIIKDLQDKARDEIEEVEKEPKKETLILFESDSEEEEDKPRKNKYRAPEFMIIIDDLSNELKNTILTKLIKMNRHWKTKCIISTQYANDLSVSAIKNCDYILVFGGQPEEKMLKLYNDSGLNMPFDIFYQIYKNATTQKYHFLYIDTVNDELRKDFNKLYRYI